MPTPRTMTPADGVAWITGASSGIGEAVALRLAREGWTVIASARRAEALSDLALRAEAGAATGNGASKGRIVPWALDVTDLAAVRMAVAAIESAHGPMALAILNAGTFKPDTAEHFQAERLRETMELNVLGVGNCLDPVLPQMIARARGQIAIVSSLAGYRGLPRSISYGASKAALINMTESLKLDGDRLGIKVQLVNPGFVRTPLTDKNDFPMPFLMEVEEAAAAFVDGLKGRGFEIIFPRRLAFILGRLRTLPYAAYFPLVRKGTGQ